MATTAIHSAARLFRFYRHLIPAAAMVLVLLPTITLSAPAPATNAAAATDFAAFQVISQRNIFNQNREPRSAPRAAPKVVDAFSLVGTMSYAKGNFAFFDGTGSQFRKVLQVGGRIAGFKVAAITPDAATLADGTNRTVLKVATQLRRDDAGHWEVSIDPVAYSDTILASNSGGSNPTHFQHDHGRDVSAAGGTLSTPAATGLNRAAAGTNPPESAEAAGSTLERLMRLRQRQEQQIGR